MKITFLAVGSIKKPYAKDGFNEYLKRIASYAQIETIDIKEEKYSVKTPRAEVLKREGERILAKLKPADFNIVLSDKGTGFSSEAFAIKIGDIIGGRAGKKGIAFVIGGPYGLSKEVLEAADLVLSLSRMTLPHDLARLFLAEQVYRAFTILRNEPYSH
ncbi:MAG: 23S rRNA (pseudouridine(1915)-N(3))-methyltransferase RlmH [Deltaproteobacteria bacterium]|nr:23S rRNA (pseudouridine(1915)-N(3))-methyltransferase RlmH [Deltaproteobacteria bacterium]